MDNRQASIWSARFRLGPLDISLPQVLIASGIALYAFAMPGDLKFKLDAMGFSVCHQIHTHSFYIGGHQLPLCARCTGLYLGAFAALFLMSQLRRHSFRWPPAGTLSILGLFFGAMAADGINSTFQTFGGGWWDSTNLVRLLTGTLAGLSLSFVFYPVFNASLWHRTRLQNERVLAQPLSLLPYLTLSGLLVALVLTRADWLLYPVSLLSIGGLLALLTMANTLIVLLITRKEGHVRTRHDMITFVLVGIALSLLLLTLMAWGRASLAPVMEGNVLGVPVRPGLP